jgi:serine protease Do
MYNFLKPSALLLLAGLSVNAYAQTSGSQTLSGSADKNESIIIRKKGKSTEKLTIVVDGDKITVNGKPVDEYKNSNVEVYKDDARGSGSQVFTFNGPAMASGDWDMFKNGFGKDIKSNKALLGVMTEKTDDGAKVTDLTDESAAAKAGLKQGDVITKLNDDKIEDGDDLYKAVGKYKPEDKVTITYKRDGKENTTTATLQKNKELRIYGLNSGNNFNLKLAPSVRSYSFYRGKPRMGVQVQDTEDGKGVKVLDVEDETPADKAGLKEDDIITKVNDKEITAVDDLKNIVKDGKEGDVFKVTYLRGTETKTVDVKYPKELKTTNL